MNKKLKILFIMLALNIFSYSKDENTVDKIEKFNSNLIVQGEGIKERIDYTLYPQNIELIPNNATSETIKKIKNKNQKELFLKQEFNYETNTIENGLHNGKTNSKLAIYAEDGASIHNIGKILSYDQKINTNYGGVLITGIDNPLIRNDNLIGLKGNLNSFVNFKNDGQIEMGATEHVLAIPVNIAGLIPTGIIFGDYDKYVINASCSNIENNGTITTGIDKVKYIKVLDVGILNGAKITTDRRMINLQQGSIKNTGLIKVERQKQFEIINGVAVDLLQIGIHFDRNDYGINLFNEKTLENVEKNIKSINSGKIFVGGDIYSQGYSGIGVGALGADFVGKHNKYGINTKNSTFINTGTIEVERDLAKAYDDNNNIVDLYLFYKNFLKLGLLSFNSLKETSIGANISGGEFYNNGGTISVGVNGSKKYKTQLRSAVGIAVAGSNGASIYFNTNDDKDGKEIEVKSIINLEGIDVYATWLEGNSTVTFNGITEINFKPLPNLSDKEMQQYNEKRNRHIFYTDNSSEVKIKGKVIVNGDIDIGDYKIGRENHHDRITVGSGYEAVKDKDGKIVGFDKKAGEIISTGKIGLNGNIKLDTTNFVGMSREEVEKFIDHKYIEAKEGIEGEGNIVSNSYLFNIETNKDNNSISLANVERKNFNTIVKNKELGNLLETNYNDNLSDKHLEFYKLLASGEDYNSFSNKLNEVTGIENITTLETQIMDITKDLNRQYRDFTKNNTNEGILFSYLNSKSEINKNGKYEGFKRESNGFMGGYNKYISNKERLGFGFSYMKSNIDYTSDSSNKIETWNVRIYSDYKLKDINLLTDLSFGYNESENKRYVNNNLNNGNVNIYTIGLNNSLYKNYKITDKLSISPSLNLDFTYYYQDDYKEKNDDFSVNAEKTDGYYATLGTATDLKYNIFSSEKGKISLIGGVECSYDILNKEDNIELENTIGKFSEAKRKIDKSSLSYNVGIAYDYNEDYSIQVKYSKEMINDVDNEKIGVNFSYKF